MARHYGPKNRLARKVGSDLGLKTNVLKSNRRITSRPGQHGATERRKISDYGKQLTEKQKVRLMYGLMEKQFRRTYEKAAKTPASTGKVFLQMLERRLDNVVYRLGFAPTRAAARQIVAHGNAKVNGEKVSIPSYLVKVGQVVSITETAAKIPATEALMKEKDKALVAWLDRQGTSGKVVRFPEREEIDPGINEQLIVEFYSR